MKVSHRSILAASSFAALSVAQNSSVTCVDGAYIVVARASGEPTGFGILGLVKDDILKRIPNSSAIAVPYPATILDPGYNLSEPWGVGNMTEIVQEYGDACPGHKMVLMGYSQGAQVTADVLVGNANEAFPTTEGLAQSYVDNVVAVIMMGDPTNVANQSFLVGNSTKDGIFDRPTVEEWTQKGLVNKVQSYCDAYDTYCDSGANRTIGSAVHASYVGVYGEDAVNFVVAKFEAAANSNGTGTGSGSGNGTSGGTPSTTSSAPGTSQTQNPYTGASARNSPSQYIAMAGLAAYALIFTSLL